VAIVGSERREFTRLPAAVEVRCKFLSSHVQDEVLDRVCEGTSTNVSLGGLLLLGPIPRLEWLKDLLVGKMNVGVNIYLPNGAEPLKALCRVAWVDAIEEGAMATHMGLRVQEMPAEHRKALSDYLMRIAKV
jgi:hypothetical protein